jgi:ERCC4-type nuclease
VILLDPRFGESRGKSGAERRRAFTESLEAFGVDVTVQMLDSGDCMFVGQGPDGPIRVGVELKTVSDFVTSMLSGRLADQLERMVNEEQYDRIYVVIEGVYRVGRKTGMIEIPRGGGWRPLQAGPRPIFWADIEKFVTGMEEAGIRVRRTRTTNETARVLAQVLCSFWSKPYDEHKSLNVLYRPQAFMLVREDADVRRARQVAACLPGVGVGRSKAVVQHFGSIDAMVNADEDDWRSVEGIGKKLAGDIWKAIRVQVSLRSTTSKGRVSPRRGAAPRSPRHSVERENRRVDANRRPERSVHTVGNRHRKPR